MREVIPRPDNSSATAADSWSASSRDDDGVVSPTFSASYSGLFKMFFDVLDDQALAGKPVLLGATGGTFNNRRIDFTANGATLRGGAGNTTLTSVVDTHAKNFTLAGGASDADSLTFAPASLLSSSSSNTVTIASPGRVIFTNPTPFEDLLNS